MSDDSKDANAGGAPLRAQTCRMPAVQTATVNAANWTNTSTGLTEATQCTRLRQESKTKFLWNRLNLKRPALIVALMLLGTVWAAWRVTAAPSEVVGASSPAYPLKV